MELDIMSKNNKFISLAITPRLIFILLTFCHILNGLDLFHKKKIK